MQNFSIVLGAVRTSFALLLNYARRVRVIIILGRSSKGYCNTATAVRVIAIFVILCVVCTFNVLQLLTYCSHTHFQHELGTNVA